MSLVFTYFMLLKANGLNIHALKIYAFLLTIKIHLSEKRVSLLCHTNNMKALLGMLPCQTANCALSVQHLMINDAANVALVK